MQIDGPLVADGISKLMDHIADLEAQNTRIRNACENLFLAYRARYLTPSTDRMRSNAPLLREMGELKLALTEAVQP